MSSLSFAFEHQAASIEQLKQAFPAVTWFAKTAHGNTGGHFSYTIEGRQAQQQFTSFTYLSQIDGFFAYTGRSSHTYSSNLLKIARLSAISNARRMARTGYLYEARQRISLMNLTSRSKR